MDITKIIRNVWLVAAIAIAVLIPIYGAWHQLFNLGICVLMYLAHCEGGEEEEEGAQEEMLETTD